MGLCGTSCFECNFKEECNGCSFCEATICKRYCSYCESLCPNRYGNQQYSTQILKSLNRDYKLKGNNKINLPKFIPDIPDKLNIDMELPLIALDGNKFLSSNGRKVNNRFMVNGVNRAMGLRHSSNVILHFYIKDKKLNGFWLNRDELYEKLKQFNFHGIITPNFSVYEDAPRMDHLYNIKRNICVYNGVAPTFPTKPTLRN